MAEIVGSAYVRVRALTKQLNKDIKDAVENSVKDADAKGAGGEAGKDFSEGFDESLGGSISEAIASHLSGNKAFDDFGDHIGTSISEAISNGLSNQKTKGDAEVSGEEHADRWGSGFAGTLRRVFDTSFLNIFRSGRSRRIKDYGDDGDESGRSFGDRFKNAVGGAFSGVGRIFKGFAKSALRGASTGLVGLGKRLFKIAGLTDSDAEKQGEKFGTKMMKKIGSGMVKAATSVFSILGKLIFNKFTLIVAAVVSVLPLIVQTITGLVALLGTVINGIVGGLVAISSGLLVGVVALGPIIAAFLAKTPMLELFKEEMGEIGKEMKGIAEAAQKEVLPGILLVAKTFSSKFTPTLTEFSSAIGKAFGDFTEHISDFLKTDKTVSRINTILLNSASGFRKFLNSLRPLIDAMLTVFAALSSVAPRIADDLDKLFSRFSTSVNTAGVDGLSETFNDLYDTFTLVMGGLADLSLALYNLFAIGSDSIGTSFFETFREWAATFRDWTESAEGIDAITAKFAKAKPVFSEFSGLLKDIFFLIYDNSSDKDAGGGTLRFIQYLREDVIPWIDGTLIPGIQTSIDQIKKIGGAVGDFLAPIAKQKLDNFKDIFQEVVDFGKANGPSIIDTFSNALKDLQKPLADIAKNGGDVFVNMLRIILQILTILIEAGVLQLFADILVVIVNVISKLTSIPGVTEFFAVFLVVAKITPMLAKLGTVARALGAPLTLLLRTFKFLAPAATALATILDLPVIAIGAIIVAVIILVAVIVKNWDKIVGFFKDLPKHIGQLLTWIKEKMLPAIKRFFGRIPKYITSALKAAGRAVKTASSAIFAALKSVFSLDTLKKVFNSLKGLGKILLGIFKAAFNFVKDKGPEILSGILGFVSSIPGKIFSILMGLGSVLLSIFTAAFDFVVTNGLSVLGKFLTFILELPFRIIMLLGGMGIKLFNWLKSAFQWVVDNGPSILMNLINWLKSIPGKIKDALVGLKDKLFDWLKSAFNWVKDKGPDIISGVIDFFKGLPGKIFSAIRNGLSSGGKAAAGIAKDIFNAIVGFLNEHLIIPVKGFEVKFFKTKFKPFNFLPEIPKLSADGGIFKTATNIIAGEDGKEVLIPLTRPKRALELASQSGLFSVLKQASAPSTGFATLPRLARSPASTEGNSMPQVIFESGAIDARGLDPVSTAEIVAQRLAWKMSLAGGSR